MWLRDFRSPPKALALLQVYHRFAPLTDSRGLTWRIQVEQDVCLQAFLVAGPPQGSFLHVRRGPTLELQPPLLRIEGQLESLFLNELPLESWIAQGTRWWLRNLGSVLVDKPLRLTLLNALIDMDRARYPELESAIAYHPVIPLVNGDWISLDQLRTYSQIFQSKGWTKGWHGGVPVVQVGGAIQELIDVPVVALEGPPPNEIIRWSYSLDTSMGRAVLTNLGPEYYRLSSWVLGNPNEPDFCCEPLFDDNPLSLSIAIDIRRRTPPYGVPADLRVAIQEAILNEAAGIVLDLKPYPGRLHEICSLLVLMRSAKQEPPQQIWDLHYDSLHSLGDVRDGKATTLGQFLSGHPILQLTPDRAGVDFQNFDAKPSTDHFQLQWTQRCGSQDFRVQFLARRDGMNNLTVPRTDGRTDRSLILLAAQPGDPPCPAHRGGP